MITTRFRIILIVLVICYFTFVFKYIQNKRLLLKYSLVWLMAGIFMGLIVIWPSLLNKIAAAFGIYSETNALFALSIGFVLIILMTLTAIVSRQAMVNKTLAQRIALLEKRIRDIEAK